MDPKYEIAYWRISAPGVNYRRRFATEGEAQTLKSALPRRAGTKVRAYNRFGKVVRG